MALEKMDYVATAFVTDKVELYLTEDAELDQEEIKSALASTGATFIDLNKEDSTNL